MDINNIYDNSTAPREEGLTHAPAESNGEDILEGKCPEEDTIDQDSVHEDTIDPDSAQEDAIDPDYLDGDDEADQLYEHHRVVVDKKQRPRDDIPDQPSGCPWRDS